MKQKRAATEKEFRHKLKSEFPKKREREVIRWVLGRFENVSAQDMALDFLSASKKAGKLGDGMELLLDFGWEVYFKNQPQDIAGDPDAIPENKMNWNDLFYKLGVRNTTRTREKEYAV